ncbi:MAG: DUF935 domain-containing protein [Candidatus Binatus sp.]|jgi:phage gp29-like protein
MPTLFDAYGREVKPAFLRVEQAAPTMAGVRNIYSVTHPSVGITPEKLFGILTQAEFGDPFLYLELAEEMEEKDPHYLGVLGTRKEACSQLAIIVKPASQSRDDMRAADMVSACLKSPTLNFGEALFDVLDAIGKGFSATEILWDTSGREWYPRALKWRDPRYFMFNWVNGEEILVRTLKNEQTIPEVSPRVEDGAPFHARSIGNGPAAGLMLGRQPLTAPLAPFKFVTHFAKAKSGLPIRGGLARALAWTWAFKNYCLKDWLGFAETYGQPFRVGKYQAGASESERQALLTAVRRVGPDAAAIMPENMMIEFIQAREAKGETFMELSAYLDAQISKAVLGQTLTTELPRGGGSRAAAQVHQGVRRDILASDARRLASTLARDLVFAIVTLNMGPQTSYPAIELGLPDDVDEKVYAEIISMLADRGLKVEQRGVRDALGIAEPAAGADTLHPLATKEETTP